MIRILVALPALEMVKTDCIQSVYTMNIPEGVNTKIVYFKGYGAAQSRNIAACMCIDENYDYILYVDSDQIVPKNTFERLLACDSPVAAGWSMMNVADNRSNISVYDKPNKNYNFILQKDVPKSEVIEVDAIGFSCVLVKRTVFDSLEYPYFKYVEYKDRTRLSEDLYFCNSLKREHGIVIKCDTSLKIGHIKQIVI